MNAPPAAETPDGSFVSFSTNYEDVVLRRLFRGRTAGFFVDVGAQHPCLGNDFYNLYTHGWTGINIEPNPSYFALLQEQRPRDLNLQLALSDVADVPLVFFEVEGSGLSTCDEAQAATCAAQGYIVKRHDVRSSTLSNVLESTGASHVDILKVDVEGLEESVLLGNDWERFRPSVIMVEVTYPETSVRRPTNIRRNLEALGYRHIHFDNLNDFFADAGFAVPQDALLPPNVFDNFVKHDFVALGEENASIRANFLAAETYAHALEAEHASIGVERDALLAERTSLQTALGDVTAGVEALGHENMVLQHRGKTLNEALEQAVVAAEATRRVAVAAMLGRSDQVRALLAPRSASGVEQEKERPMPEQSKELVTIAGEGVTDGDVPPASSGQMPAAVRSELLAAQMQALDEQNKRFHNDIEDLRHENRRLLASLRQAQGENLSLQRALGPSYATRDELLQLRERIASLQTEVGHHHQAMSADFETRVQTALNGRMGPMSGHGELPGMPAHPDRKDNLDARLLNAMLTSTSWRVTRPLRAFRSLFGTSRK